MSQALQQLREFYRLKNASEEDAAAGVDDVGTEALSKVMLQSRSS